MRAQISSELELACAGQKSIKLSGSRGPEPQAAQADVMFWKPKNKEANRYYLLPGMGRSNRRHHKNMFYVALGVGAFCALLIGVLLFVLERNR